MLTFRYIPIQLDAFSASEVSIIDMEIRNEILNTKETIRISVAQKNLYRDSRIVLNLKKVLFGMYEQRRHALQSYESTAPQQKWDAILHIQDGLSKFKDVKGALQALRFYKNHLEKHYNTIIPGRESRFYKNYTTKLAAISGFIKQELDSPERIDELKKLLIL